MAESVQTMKELVKQNNKLNAVKHKDGAWWIYVGDDGDDILLKGLGGFESKEVADRVIKAFSCGNN